MPATHRLERSQRIARPLPEVFAFFSDAANLEAITPGFLRFRIITPQPIEMRPGARIDYSLSLFGVRLRWLTRITVWEPGVRFVDEQESGPYALWRHTHSFAPDGDATIMSDTVEYALPLGPLGSLAHLLFVRRTVGAIFDHRARVIDRLLGPAAARPSGHTARATPSGQAAPARPSGPAARAAPSGDAARATPPGPAAPAADGDT